MNLKRISINTVSQLLGRAISLGLTLTSTIVLRRYLGRADYGQYIYITNIILIATSFSDLGTYLTTVRESAISSRESPNVFSPSILLRGLLGLIASIIFFMLQVIFPTTIISPVILFTVMALINIYVLKDSLAMIFHSLERLYVSSLLQAGSSVLNLMVIAAMVLTHQGLGFTFIGNVLTLSAGIMPLFLLVARSNHLSLNPQWEKICWLFKQSIPLGGVLILFTIYSRIDSFIMYRFLGISAVGTYGVAYKIYDNLTLPAAFLLNALLPEFSRLAVVHPPTLGKICLRTIMLLTLISAVVILGVYLLSPVLMWMITGEWGGAEIEVVRALSWATLFAYANHVTGFAAIALGQQKKSLIVAVIALVFNTLINWWLLPIGGMMVSAWLTVATEALVLVLSGMIVWNRVRSSL